MISKNKIDLNLDAGELPTALLDGSEEALYQVVTSVNVACGGHTGDESTMKKTVELAMKYNLNIGAHPSFPDRKSFGREMMQMSHDQLVDSLMEQTENLRRICVEFGVKLSHLKPHGALYNWAAQDRSTAVAIMSVIKNLGSEPLPIMGLAGSKFIDWIRQAGLTAIEEAFVDRRYESNGMLRSRKHHDAVIKSPELAAAQARQIIHEESVFAVTGESIRIHADTLCVHGDSQEALLIAKAVRDVLSAV